MKQVQATQTPWGGLFYFGDPKYVRRSRWTVLDFYMHSLRAARMMVIDILDKRGNAASYRRLFREKHWMGCETMDLSDKNRVRK